MPKARRRELQQKVWEALKRSPDVGVVSAVGFNDGDTPMIACSIKGVGANPELYVFTMPEARKFVSGIRDEVKANPDVEFVNLRMWWAGQQHGQALIAVQTVLAMADVFETVIEAR